MARLRHLSLALLLPGPLAAAAVHVLLPPPRAHWSDHVLSASAAGGVLVAVAVGAWLVRTHLHLAAALILTALCAGLNLEMVGNIMAGRSIWQEPYGDDDVAAATQGLTGFEVGHDLAGWGDGLVVLSGVALAVYAGARHWISGVTALAGAVLAFFPPWIYPAVGAAVVLVSTVIRDGTPYGPNIVGKRGRGPHAEVG